MICSVYTLWIAHLHLYTCILNSFIIKLTMECGYLMVNKVTLVRCSTSSSSHFWGRGAITQKLSGTLTENENRILLKYAMMIFLVKIFYFSSRTTGYSILLWMTCSGSIFKKTQFLSIIFQIYKPEMNWFIDCHKRKVPNWFPIALLWRDQEQECFVCGYRNSSVDAFTNNYPSN